MGTLSQVAKDTGGRLYGKDQNYLAVSTDTRTINPGDLFLALSGEKYDANNFISDALDRGAVGAIVQKKLPIAISQVQVSDSRKALHKLAQVWRKHFSIPLIGITGSNGKTTIKELSAAILRVSINKGRVLATIDNQNNEIGLPLTILNLCRDHQAAVIEMGASQIGDIKILAGIALPNIAVISNAARAHLLGFGGIDEVAATKGEILDSIGHEDTAILNQDDPFFSKWFERAGPAKVITFGANADADFYPRKIRNIEIDGHIGFEFELVTPLGSEFIELPLAGKHNVSNAIAASAAAVAAGANLAAIRSGLLSSRNIQGRLRAIPLKDNTVIYDDSYNANPDSVSAAISFLASLQGEAILVLGDMGELGSNAEKLHFDIGRFARKSGIKRLLCIGQLSQSIARGFGESAQWFLSLDELYAAVSIELSSGCNILIKASRFMGLDELVNRIKLEAGKE
ncbi:MAG: UDP-N-acetylmuramoyl-tripeptide--D-alanyl-D-alanine ligase [Pseudomonadota bacterium]|nr:UDP-N-acetylmuramoyl-tripeptide--D-alanyl-D-alanine ligase [Pseudomonadota bacterium]